MQDVLQNIKFCETIDIVGNVILSLKNKTCTM